MLSYLIHFHYLQFTDENQHADSYAVLYAVDNKPSFQYAVDLLYELRHQEQRQEAVILVANKTDLVRTRVISLQGTYPLHD